MRDVQEALLQWQAVLGSSGVTVEGASLELANTATYATKHRVHAMLHPTTREEVAACLQIAREFRVPLYPVSAGCNWGYGSKTPPQHDCILLSLARLNRIVEFDEELAYVTVEPGVTFRQLADFLQERGSTLLPVLVGTSPDASLIGNALERGIGKGPYEDISAHTCNYEVMLATGEVVHTGYGGWSDAHAAPLHRTGPGPSLQGLFSQSNFGVVTAMTFWLERAPAWRQQVLYSIRDRNSLEGALDALRDPQQRMGKSLQVELINDYRLLTQSRQFPYSVQDGRDALPRSWVQQHLHLPGAYQWFVSLTLWGDEELILALHLERLSQALAGHAELLHATDPHPGQDVRLSADGLHSSYWRKRHPVPDDPHPDRDRCGLIWLTTCLPQLGSVAVPVLEQIEQHLLDSGFEPSLSLRLLDGRTLHVMALLLYDRDEEGGDARAARCHREISALCREQGHLPYRLGVHNMEVMQEMKPANANLLHMLKTQLDPSGILAPGRYQIEEEEWTSPHGKPV
jgi:4-cresol dehydrogenase (hydroxylating)